MPPPFRKHVFVCLNERPPDAPKGDCTRKGSPELLKKLKAALRRAGSTKRSGRTRRAASTTARTAARSSSTRMPSGTGT